MKLSYIISAVITVGGVAGIVYLIKKSDKEDNKTNNELDLKPLKSEKKYNSTCSARKTQENNEADIDVDGAITEFTGRKINAIGNIVDRRQDVAPIMQESLEHIVNENSLEEFKSENIEDLDNIDDALDKLLEE